MRENQVSEWERGRDEDINGRPWFSKKSSRNSWKGREWGKIYKIE